MQILKKIKSVQKETWIFWALIVFLLVPSFFISSKATIRALYPVLILAGLFNSKRALSLLLLPFLVFVPCALWFWQNYHSPLNVTFWLIMFGTNIKEGFDFLKDHLLPLFAAWVAVMAVFVWAFRQIRGPIFKSPKWRWGMMVFLLVPLSYVKPKDGVEGYKDKMIYHFSASYPFNVLMGYQAAKAEIKKYQDLDFSKNFDLQVHGSVGPDVPETYVLILGESARRDRHSLYGYSTKTNPEMEKEQGLLLFKDVVTLHPHTAASVPTILTKDDNFENPKDVPPSFIQVFKGAGFKTYWISNQAAMGDGDNKVAIYAKKSDYFKSLHLHNASLPWAYDGDLLPDFYERLKEPSPKKFIVIHLQGSHYGFDKRYPSEFAQFKDMYDNTILYTDHVLAEVLKALKEQKGFKAMMYVSDHGLMLGECDNKYTHFDIKQSFEIPFFVWTSPEWKQQYPKKYSQALQNQEKKLTSKFVFDSLVDIADLRYQGFQDQYSVFEPQAIEEQRLVKTYSQIVDYDHSQNDKDCHLVPAK